jgi:hypothetical protein
MSIIAERRLQELLDVETAALEGFLRDRGSEPLSGSARAELRGILSHLVRRARGILAADQAEHERTRRAARRLARAYDAAVGF